MAAAAAGAGVTDPARSVETGGGHTGGCHCGAVTYRAQGLRDMWYCHCRQCRRLTGHVMAACWTRRDDLEVSGEVVWTPVSDRTAHGFCAVCRSPLFWSNRERDSVSVLGGSLDHSAGIVECGHLFVSEKGDYYQIADGLPQYATWPEADDPDHAAKVAAAG
ncbi:MAG: GFA family protein [Sphingomonadales bacterium]|nr:GFA family protein [Sphingomonadales bacterium]